MMILLLRQLRIIESRDRFTFLCFCWFWGIEWWDRSWEASVGAGWRGDSLYWPWYRSECGHGLGWWLILLPPFRSQKTIHLSSWRGIYSSVPSLVKVTGRVASLDVMFIPQTSKSSTTMAEASSTAISSSPCHLGGITRLAFAPDGQYVNLTSHLFPFAPLV